MTREPDEVMTVQIVPAAAGWRAVFLAGPVLDGKLNPHAAKDEELWFERPIACFALVENQDAVRYVRPIGPDDWPEYLWELDDHGQLIAFLGPGQEVDDELREALVREAEKLIHNKEEEKAAARAEAQE